MRDFLYHLSDGFVFQTMDARDYFGKYAIERGTVIANPLTGKLPEPYKGIRKKKFVTAVRLDPQKNLEMLIDAFRGLKNYIRIIHWRYMERVPNVAI